MSDLLDPIVLFGEDPHPGDCCDCCSGYCVRWDDAGEWAQTIPTLVTCELNGQEYIGTRYIIVRADLVAPMPKDAPEPTPVPNLSFATFPDSLPEALDDKHSPVHMERLIKSGLSTRGTDSITRFLYRGDKHIGWTTCARPDAENAIRRADFELVELVAAKSGISLDAAAAALNLIRGDQ